MAITDETQLLFNSNWEIDQILASASVAVSAGATNLYTLQDASLLPVFEVQFKPTGSSFWYQMGRSRDSGTETHLHAYLQAGALYINTNLAGTAKYYVWTDKVTY